MIIEAYILTNIATELKIINYILESDKMHFVPIEDDKFCCLYVHRNEERTKSKYNFSQDSSEDICFPSIPVFIQDEIKNGDKHKSIKLCDYGIIGVMPGLNSSVTNGIADYNKSLSLLPYISSTSKSIQAKVTAGNFILENSEFNGYTEVKLENNKNSLFKYFPYAHEFYPVFVTMENIDTELMIKAFEAVAISVYKRKNKNVKNSENKDIKEIMEEVLKEGDSRIADSNKSEIKTVIENIYNKLGLLDIIGENSKKPKIGHLNDSKNKDSNIKQLSEIKKLDL